MKEQEQKMKLPKLDDLFTIQEQRDYEKAEKVEEINISSIKDFPNHPFKVINDEKMQEMVKSVKEYGVILPVIVRPKEDGTYEMISGHRRKRACELAGIKQIRCIVKDLTDDEATILMVDSNIQREEILPSEKAFAYKLKLEAMKHQGKRIDLEENETSTPVVSKLRTDEILGEEVDNKRIAFRPAVELSYLEEDYQYVVLNKLQYDEVSPSLSQAITLKKMQQEGTISEEKIENLLDTEKPNQKEFIKIHNDRIEKYLPTKVKDSGKIEDFIIQCVEEHNNRERLKQERNAR